MSSDLTEDLAGEILLNNVEARDASLQTEPVKAHTLRECVEETLHQYFTHLEGHEVSCVYDMVMSEVEAPLLEVVLRYTQQNQSKAAEVLGLNRGTLRKKLKQHDLL